MRLSRSTLLLAGALMALAAAAPAVASGDEPGGSARPMIIDGQNAESGPWAARLFLDGRENCSASIIAPTWVLTAEHCVDGGEVSFHIGDVDQTKGEQATQVPNGVHTHPTADLALVEIDHAVQTEYSTLGEPGAVSVGDKVQIYGWGATCTNPPESACQSQHLKVANVDVYEVNNSCTDYRGAKAVCAQRGDGIAAGGDSGGPMFAGDVQVGVASTSDRQSKTQYTNVTEYRDWIKQIAGV